MPARATAALAVLLALTGPGGAVAQGVSPGAPAETAPAEAAPATPPTGGATVTAPTAPVAAGATAVLTVNQEALYEDSLWGKRALAELAARRRDVLAENERIVAELEAEDDALTALRTTLPADEFRRRADAFDARVQQVRQEREAAGDALIEAANADRDAFLNAALPVFTAVMRERGATVILDRRTVFLAADAVDATAIMIARIDAQLGTGSPLPPPAQTPTPQTPQQTAPQSATPPAATAPAAPVP